MEEGGEVFVVVAEITGEFGDFEGLAAVVLDVADDVLQDLCPLRFGSVGAVEGALAVDFAENSGSQAVVEERVVETQGTIGTEHKLTPAQIADADVVILAVDVKISEEERFKGKPVIRVGTATVIKNAIGFIEKVEKALENKN